MWSTCRSFTWIISFIASVHAVKLFSNSTVPTNLTAACTSALSSDVNCSPFVVSLRTGMYYPNDTLERTCTANCDSALASYRARIVTACATETWLGYQDAILPVLTIPEMLQYQYNLTCLMDSGRYCNNVAASYAAGLDPSENNAIDGGAGLGNGAGNATDPCDLCFIKNLRFQAGSPYYDGPALAESSIYEQKTSSCGISGFPLITTALPFPTPTQPSTAPSTTCAGKTYEVKSGDDCHLVSKSQKISNTWLLTDNNLAANCVDFPTKGSLCLVNTCDVYTVGQNDTCASIAKAHNITESQFKSWNPDINTGCYNLARMNGSEMCISAPGKPYIYPSATTLAPRIPVTAAPVPTDAAQGTNTKCGRWYRVELGDYCNMIVIKFGTSLEEFKFLNPAINENCTNLYAEESYCVLAVGDINTYSGRPGYQASTIAPFVPSIKFSDLPDATYTSTTKTSTALPLATDTRGDCFMYFEGDEYQESLSGTNWNSPCELAAAVYNVRLEDLQTWNPALGNTSLSSCAFTTGVRYCGKWYTGDPPPDQTSSGSVLPIRPNTTENCTEYLDVTDDWDCASILDIYHLTIAQFFQYNPSVGKDCSLLWLNYQYCVRGPSYVDETVPLGTTPSDAPITSTVGPSAPTLTGQPSNCNKWHTVKSGDSCASVENTYFITSEQFLLWNKAVSADCSAGFWLDYAYCVGTTDPVSASRTSQPPPPTSTTSSSIIPLPTPNQPNNAISNCNRFAAAQDGDWCARFADRNKITAEQLYGWNSVLGPDGSGCANQFWSGYYYCVSVSSSA